MRRARVIPVLRTGCTVMQTRQVEQAPVRAFESSRSAASVAGCLLESLPGVDQSNRGAPWPGVIARAGTAQAPGIRWDVLANDGGSRVTFADTPEVANEEAQARACGGVS